MGDLNEILKFGIFSEFSLVLKLPPHEALVVEGVGEKRLALITLPDLDVNEPRRAGLHQEVDIFSGMEGKGELVVEGQNDQLLVVDAQRDHLCLAGGVYQVDLKVVPLGQ
jgi:hypothetical protein